MAVSIALTTYNGDRHLREQLTSIVAQTELPGELVASDDGSTDGTLDVLNDFVRHAPFPVTVLPPHAKLGFADNFLHAAAHCRHDLVMFADQDDVWLPEKLERGRRRIEEDGSMLSMHTLTLTDEELTPLDRFAQGIRGDAVFEPLALEPYMTGWGNTMMFRRELATLIPRERRPKQAGMDRLLSHDSWIYTLAAALGRVSHIRDSLILYRQHTSNVWGVRNATLSERIAEWLTAPVSRYRQREIFDSEVTGIFEALIGNGLYGSAAVRAAERYDERRRRMATRIAMFQAPSVAQRFRAFRSVWESVSGEGRLSRDRLLSAAKDLTLGVAGWGMRE